MENLWQKYESDFNAMSDDNIEYQCKISESLIDEEEEWLEAVASWKAAGKPRKELEA